MDNLDSHTNNAVQALIFGLGHRLVFRPRITLFMEQLNMSLTLFNVH